jgi:hypothetical protein
MTKEALNLALEALEVANSCVDGYYIPKGKTHLPEIELAITAIKEALAQPEQPKVRTGDCLLVGVCASEGHKIQPQRTWVGLTDEEKNSFWKADQMTQKEWDELFSDIEAKLRSKNT